MKRKFSFVRYLTLIILGVLLTALAVLFFGKIDETIEVPGIVAPQDLIHIRVPISGIIEEVWAKEGQLVKVGDTLLLIDNGELFLQVEKARQNLENYKTELSRLTGEYDLITKSSYYESGVTQQNLIQAKRMAEISKEKYDRSEELYRQNLIGIEERNDIKLNWELADAGYKTAKQQLAIMKRQYQEGIKNKVKEVGIAEEALKITDAQAHNAVIKAPRNGVVLTSVPENLNGAYVNVGQEVLQIADPEKVQFVAYVNERDMPKIKVGQEAKIFINAYPHRKYGTWKGKVKEIAALPKVEKEEIAWTVGVEFINIGFGGNNDKDRLMLMPGLPGKAKVVIETRVVIVKKILQSLIKQ